MKILLITLLLFIALGAKAEWRPHRGFGFGRGRGPPWGYPQQNQININSEGIEWVCQNPKTNDIMIIASDDTPQQQPQQPQHPGRGPWWQWQSQPPGHQNHHQQQDGNHWTVITKDPTQEGTHNQFPKIPEIPNNNHQSETTPHYHGGEGLIDIRMGE